MSEKILSDDEKDALLDGVATGEVEILSTAGSQYAAVNSFEIPDRSRIVSNSYPRLQTLNQRFAGLFSKPAEQMVSAETEITWTDNDTCTYGQSGDRDSALSLVFEFSAKPLNGSALIYFDAALVRQLVESFYGGVGNEPPSQHSEDFTPGEVSVASLFCNELLKTLQDVWQPLIDSEHEQRKTHRSTDLIDGFDPGDTVICAAFEICFLKQSLPFRIVWPLSMLTPLLPVLEGQKRERDPAEDARWERSIRSRLTDSVVAISSRVGKSQLTLGAVAELSPGDIIDIDNPRDSTVFVKQVPILEGRFGIHEGHYAIEATDWLGADSEMSA